MEVEFREGIREVPDHLAVLMRFDTHVLTYDEAIARLNKQLLEDHVSRAMDDMIKQHFMTHGGRR